MVHHKWELIPGNNPRDRDRRPARVRGFFISLLVSTIMWVAVLRLAACGRL